MAETTHHVVWALAGVSEGKILRHNSVEHHLHVVPHVRVPVLVDGEGGGGVEQLDVHQSHRELRQLGKLQHQSGYHTAHSINRTNQPPTNKTITNTNVIWPVKELLFSLSRRLTPLRISSVTRWTPRCCGRRWTLRCSQAFGPTMRPEPCWEP